MNKWNKFFWNIDIYFLFLLDRIPIYFSILAFFFLILYAIFHFPFHIHIKRMTSFNFETFDEINKKEIIISSLLCDTKTQTTLDRHRETWKYQSEKGHPVHPPNALFAPVRPLTQISLASARAFSIPLEKNPVQTLLTPFRDGQSEGEGGGGRGGGARRVSQEDREDEAWNRRILFSAIDIVRARSRIKLSRAGEMPLLLAERGGVCQSVGATLV